MGPEYSICSVFFPSGIVSFADIGRSYYLLGAVVEEMAVRLAERVRTVLCCGGAVVVVLASACAQWKLNGWEEDTEG